MPPTRRSQTLSTHRLLGSMQRASSSNSRSPAPSLCDSLTSRDADGSSLSDLTDIRECYFLLQESSSSASKTKEKASAPPAGCPLAFVTINGIVLKPTKVFDAFWYWVAERKAMDDRRRAGEASPWTEDPILKKYYFCCPYRVLDRVTQYIITDVIQKGSQDPKEVVFRVVLFNTFTKIETWEALVAKLGPLKWSTYSRDKYQAVLSALKSSGQTLYTGAFQKPGPHFGFKDTFMNHLCLLEALMENQLPEKLLGAPSMADVYEYLISFPGMGDFTTYQLMLNLSYTPLLNFHPNDFSITGPGSISGLIKMFGTRMKQELANNKDFGVDVFRWFVETQNDHFQRLGISFSGLGPKKLPLDISDIEHAICEVDKYARMKFPSVKGRDGRTQMKREYKPSGRVYPPKPALPKAWSHPRRRVPRIRPGPLFVEKRYEINRIGAHREGPNGLEFFVYWLGYPDRDATWEFESSLMQDAPNVVKDYLAKIKSK